MLSTVISVLTLWILPLSEARYTRGFSNKTDSSCHAGGKPTAYSKSGCFKISKIHDKLEYTGARAVTVDGCFAYCQSKYTKSMQFFGVQNGNTCFSASLHEGTPMKKCTTPCAGDKEVMCGGVETVDMYVMFDCTPPTAEEKATAAREAKASVMNAYAAFKRQTCGKSKENTVKINGSPTLVGSVEDCKNACYKSLECHGFTYEAAVTKCSFHPDVLDGKVTKNKKIDCFYKKLGFVATKVTQHEQ